MKDMKLGVIMSVKPVMRVLLFGLLFAQVVQAQEPVTPMSIPLYLSGNFGELRGGHFHSGIDFKTQERTGQPVRAVKDGFVSRVNVSPYGYGNALYINHPDGTTSVYAHLERFAPKIETVVRNRQYTTESFAVELYPSEKTFPVKQGERIAWSGNSGGSGGPHLHFEFRNTKTGKVMDALPYYKKQILDTRPPQVQEIRLYPQFNAGIVNGKIQNQSFNVSTDKAGRKSVAKTLTAWGKIGVGIKAYDVMNETSNIYGVNEIILKMDGKVIYHSLMDGFYFEDSRYINSYIDWQEWIENKSFYIKSFTEPGNKLRINLPVNKGMITINEEKIYHLEYILKDVYDNTSRLNFNIEGKPTRIPYTPPAGTYFAYNKDNAFVGQGVNLKIPAGNLYTDTYLQVVVIPNDTAFAPVYNIGERIPLHSYCPVTLDIPNDIFPDKSKYGVVQIGRGNRSWLGGKYLNGRIQAKTRELGSFTVETDNNPPVIRPVKELNWTANQQILLRIVDDLSGIQSYKGTLDGRFVLFEYDAKSNILSCKYDSQRMKKGEQTLRLVVTDGAGNQAEYRKQIEF
ncbi:MAG: M23 family metallopeptidase [Candidatus Symbiothrix sp.]|jgi:hypothetical protein|nr:M23 family metallopeptidase [Candidatus Symbiothrix sp.]